MKTEFCKTFGVLTWNGKSKGTGVTLPVFLLCSFLYSQCGSCGTFPKFARFSFRSNAVFQLIVLVLDFFPSSTRETKTTSRSRIMYARTGEIRKQTHVDMSSSWNDFTSSYLTQGLQMVFASLLWQWPCCFSITFLLRLKLQSQLYITMGEFLGSSKYEHIF